MPVRNAAKESKISINFSATENSTVNRTNLIFYASIHITNSKE
jgi:hypothetical protein